MMIEFFESMEKRARDKFDYETWLAMQKARDGN